MSNSFFYPGEKKGLRKKKISKLAQDMQLFLLAIFLSRGINF